MKQIFPFVVLFFCLPARAANDIPLEMLNKQILSNFAVLGAKIAALDALPCMSGGGHQKLAALHANVASAQASFALGYQSYSGLVKSEIKGTGEQNLAMEKIAAESGARAKLTADYLQKVQNLNRQFTSQYAGLFKDSYISTNDGSKQLRCAAAAGKMYDGVDAEAAKTQDVWNAYSGKLLALKKDFETYQAQNAALAAKLQGSASAATPTINSSPKGALAPAKFTGAPIGRDSGVSGVEDASAKDAKARSVISAPSK